MTFESIFKVCFDDFENKVLPTLTHLGIVALKEFGHKLLFFGVHWQVSYMKADIHPRH